MTPESHTPCGDPGAPTPGARFATTRWTLVLRAGAEASGEGAVRLALEELCRAYWRPVFAFLRRSGRSVHDAQDLTQGFLAMFADRGGVERADPAKGRFRSFLLGALRHFVAHERERDQALKRGGGVRFVPIDAPDTEAGGGGAAAAVVSSELTPEQAFDRQWALALLDRVLGRLSAEQSAAGKSALFEALRSTLTGDRAAQPYEELGRRLGMSEGAVKVSVHRLRQRYREILRDEIAQTVEAGGDVEAELRDLFAVLGG